MVKRWPKKIRIGPLANPTTIIMLENTVWRSILSKTLHRIQASLLKTNLIFLALTRWIENIAYADHLFVYSSFLFYSHKWNDNLCTREKPYACEIYIWRMESHSKKKNRWQKTSLNFLSHIKTCIFAVVKKWLLFFAEDMLMHDGVAICTECICFLIQFTKSNEMESFHLDSLSRTKLH